MNETRTHNTHRHNANPRSSPQLQMVPDIDNNKTDTATAVKTHQNTNTFSTLNQLVAHSIILPSDRTSARVGVLALAHWHPAWGCPDRHLVSEDLSPIVEND